MKNPLRGIVVMTLTSSLLIATNVPSDAGRRGAKRSTYDGRWSVVINTARGPCGTVREAIQIVGGQIYSQDPSYQVYGAVGSGGVIRVTVVSGDRSAFGAGRLSRSSGAGWWQSSQGECYGAWSAAPHEANY